MSVTKKRVAIDGFDRISNLPKEVIDEILVRLPIQDSVNTSLLSKSWRYRWTSIPNLVFEASSTPVIGEQQRDKLVNFVNQVLLLHNGTVSLFKLDKFLDSGSSDIDRWILVLSRKMLNHFILKFSNLANPYRVPDSLFSCQFLKSLTLMFCELRLPSQLEELRFLTVLVLTRVILTTDTLETLVVKIPLLRVLEISRCKPLTHININAPKLETVAIAGSYTSIKFQNTPKVTRATICVTSLIRSLDEVLQGLDELQILGIGYLPFHPILPGGPAPKRLEVTFRHLKSIRMLLHYNFSKGITALLCLLRSSPVLKSLEVIVSICTLHPSRSLYRLPTSYGCEESCAHLDDENVWKAHEADIYPHLKNMTFRYFQGLEQELKLTMLILSKTAVLETLCIIWDKNVPADGKLTLEENMMQFQRASSKAKIIFKL